MSDRILISLIMAVLLSMIALREVNAQDVSAPVPALSSDGTAIDQGIACFLMMLALLLTYFLH